MQHAVFLIDWYKWSELTRSRHQTWTNCLYYTTLIISLGSKLDWEVHWRPAKWFLGFKIANQITLVYVLWTNQVVPYKQKVWPRPDEVKQNKCCINTWSKLVSETHWCHSVHPDLLSRRKKVSVFWPNKTD